MIVGGAVVFDRRTTTGDEFQARQLLQPSATLLENVLPNPASAPPVFLTPPNFFRHNWAEMVKVALTPYPMHLQNVYTRMFRQLPVRPGRFALQPISLSLGLHILAAICLPFLLSVLPFSPDERLLSTANQETIVYYRISKPEHQERMPKILPPGPGSIPGSGSLPELPPIHGSTRDLSSLFAVSHPRLPDNDHQTILQSQSPPELRMKADWKLPNLASQKAITPKKPLEFHAGNPHPVAPSKKETPSLEPSIKNASPTEFPSMLPASEYQRRPAVPVGAPSAPILPSRPSAAPGDAGVPEIVAAGGAPGQGLLILGTEPSDPMVLVALPPGNRLGQFSAALGGSDSGSPRGTATGVVGGGTGGGKTGGNESVGVGSENSGGGGGNSGTPGFVSLRGSGNIAEKLADPNPGLREGLVFALPKLNGPRHAGIVVTAGPIGGGGLEVYGVLRCGKIYTVLLPMSGRNWTLQFCPTPTPTVSVQTRSSVVHIEQVLVPPEADARYDFKRSPLPPEKAHKLIILKGTIRSEGTVENLNIHQGLMPEMDAAALRAFSQWTFKPALRGGKAVSVDVLVGIPSDGPASDSGAGAAVKDATAGLAGVTKSYQK
jgi:Gram-negative bacterial TonB protein C-terminal